jgi:bifunctional oligoribonuclease and PAP phosphatase NrnA
MSHSSYERQLEAAKAFILQHDDFLVVSHVQPDGDAAASTSAIGWILAQMGKTCMLINESAIPHKFSHLWAYERIVSLEHQPISQKFQAIISVDCADFARIGTVSSLFADQARLLNIDHHPTNDSFGTCQLVHSEAAATAEIIFDLCVLLGLKPDVDFATSIYTGLLTDTGGFRYANTTSHVLRIASELLEHGVKGAELADRLLERLTYNQVQLLQKGLSTLSLSANRKISWVCADLAMISETGASSEDLDGLVNYPRNIEGVEVGILFKQRDEHTTKVSFRSSGSVDVAAIAKTYGGGGHVRAAGCTMHGTLSEIVDRVVKEVGSKLP